MTGLDTLLTTPLTTVEEAERWIREMHEIGYGAHPDDSGASLIRAEDESPLYTSGQALDYDQRMGEAFTLLPDVYETALDVIRSDFDED